jgi:hypothetical protein
MWPYGHHFRTKDVNDGNATFDCGLEVMLSQSSCASHHDYNPREENLGYLENIQAHSSGLLIFSMCYF